VTRSAGERRLLVGSLLVLVAAACFGTLGPVSRFAYEAGATPLAFVAWRAGIGALVLGIALAFLARRGSRLADLRRVPRRQLAALVAAGVASAVLNLAIFIAFERVSIALALLGFYTYPAMVSVVAAATGRERLDLSHLLALGLAMAGMALVVLGQLDPGGALRLDLLGVALSLLAAAGQVVYVFAARGGYPSLPTRQATLLLLLVGEATYLVFALATGGLGPLLAPLGEPRTWPWLLFAGTLGAAMPVVLFIGGVRWIGGVRTAILMLFEPVVGALLAALLLSEPLGPAQIGGGALVLGGAVLVQRGVRRPAEGVGPALPEPELPEPEAG
jgi:drug/metabolite transporter (DMT)-like permease